MRTILFLFFVTAAYGYVFDCLDQCECDTEDEVIHCHNGKRTKLALPEGTRLRGFPVIGATYNNIQTLPDEETLISKFPDLKIVDVERNPEFDCDSVNNYQRIKIISDCDKNVSSVNVVPRIDRPTKDCDIKCQAERHYKKLHEYVLQLWDVLKEKYNNFDIDATWRDIREFFKKVVIQVQGLGSQIKNKWENAGNEQQSHPRNLQIKVGDHVDLPTQAPIDI
ncbi:unnamed protein product, partial [Mesorhabditis spiculigera]